MRGETTLFSVQSSHVGTGVVAPAGLASQPASRHDTPEAHTRGFLPRPKVHTLTPLMSPAGVSGQVGSDPNSQLTNPIVMGPPRTMT